MKEFRCDKCDKVFNSKEALEMHTSSKHPEEYKEPWLSNKQKRRIKTFGIFFLFFIAVAGFFFWRAIPPKNAPQIGIEPSTYNFGPVSQKNGVVSAAIAISNTGNKELILNKLDSSCGCTSVAVVYKGIEGPRFSMSGHGNNPRDWKVVIPPGDSAELKVYYDPNVHKDLRGPVKRSVFVYSNDPRNSVKEVVVSATQTD